MKDFRKFATSKMGINGMVFDDIVSMQNQYMNPYILEERQLNVTQMDVFSRLMMDRIIFLGTQIDDYTANTLQAQLLYLDSVDPGKDISIYINSPGGSVYAGLGIYDTMQFIQSPVATICTGMAASMAAVLLVSGQEGKRSALQHSRVMIHQPLGGAQGQASDIEITAREILKLKNIKLYGVGVNLTCYGAIIPKYDNLSNLCAIAEKIEAKFGIELEMVSGGNSSSIYLLGNNDALAERQLPAGINNLRLGESFVLGNDTAYETKIPGTVSDTVTLEAQIIELKTKPSLPIGEPGVDAFGQKPVYEDRGIIQRAIVAIGKQDVEPGSMTPTDPDVEILGASSDHLIVDVTKSKTEYKVGDVLEFTLGYGGLLKATTSAYVEKAYK